MDAGCRRLTASWVREAALKSPDIDTCSFFDAHEKAGQEALLPPGEAGSSMHGTLCMVHCCRQLIPGDFSAALAGIPNGFCTASSMACGTNYAAHLCAAATAAAAWRGPGVYTLHDLRVFGRKQGWCPYFLARHMMSFANVVVYNYQYMIDPKVSQVRLHFN